ncbi:MAG: OmpA family protein [Hydrogenophilaceae bacterium]|nr:OmpA family protein [Hydrogenophilaceae bacterium]
MNRMWSIAALSLVISGCATKGFVNEQVSGVNKRMDGQNAELNSRIDRQSQELSRLYSGLDGRLNSQQSALEGTSKTAKEALERAVAAGKLAEGKFIYETSLSSQIAFPFEGNTLTDQAKKALDEFAERIKTENRNVYIEIQGHTDNSGPDYTNLKIGEQRAEIVRRYLAMKHGIALHRMNAISYGESSPIADNKTRAGRIENRRVTLVVLK